MKHWTRKIRRHQRPFFVLSFFAFTNLVFPQHSAAMTIAIPEGPNLDSSVILVDIDRGGVSVRKDAPKLPEPESLPVLRVTRVVATAYSSTRGQTDGNPWTTASGARVRDGVVAANGLGFGTKVRFPDVYGDKVFIVLDRMHPRKGRHQVDIWMETRVAAKQWGVKSIKMEVLR